MADSSVGLGVAMAKFLLDVLVKVMVAVMPKLVNGILQRFEDCTRKGPPSQPVAQQVKRAVRPPLRRIYRVPFVNSWRDGYFGVRGKDRGFPL